MIPYFQSPTVSLGPFHVDGFGVFVALGVYVAFLITSRLVRAEGLSEKPLADFGFWALLAGVVGAHFVHLFAYHREELARGPLQILKVWDGLSSTGGVLGGVLAAFLYFRFHRMRFHDYADGLAVGVPVGWAIARLGCFVVHDHPGVLTNFFLAVKFPGGARHDLGLDDALQLFAIGGLMAFIHHKGWLRRRQLGLVALLYGVGRFLLDFLRAQDLSYVDARYAGLTPAQYACFLLMAYGILRLVWPARRAGSEAHTAA